MDDMKYKFIFLVIILCFAEIIHANHHLIILYDASHSMVGYSDERIASAQNSLSINKNLTNERASNEHKAIIGELLGNIAYSEFENDGIVFSLLDEGSSLSFLRFGLSNKNPSFDDFIHPVQLDNKDILFESHHSKEVFTRIRNEIAFQVPWLDEETFLDRYNTFFGKRYTAYTVAKQLALQYCGQAISDTNFSRTFLLFVTDDLPNVQMGNELDALKNSINNMYISKKAFINYKGRKELWAEMPLSGYDYAVQTFHNVNRQFSFVQINYPKEIVRDLNKVELNLHLFEVIPNLAAFDPNFLVELEKECLSKNLVKGKIIDNDKYQLNLRYFKRALDNSFFEIQSINLEYQSNPGNIIQPFPQDLWIPTPDGFLIKSVVDTDKPRNLELKIHYDVLFKSDVYPYTILTSKHPKLYQPDFFVQEVNVRFQTRGKLFTLEIIPFLTFLKFLGIKGQGVLITFLVTAIIIFILYRRFETMITHKNRLDNKKLIDSYIGIKHEVKKDTYGLDMLEKRLQNEDNRKMRIVIKTEFTNKTFDKYNEYKVTIDMISVRLSNKEELTHNGIVFNEKPLFTFDVSNIDNDAIVKHSVEFGKDNLTIHNYLITSNSNFCINVNPEAIENYTGDKDNLEFIFNANVLIKCKRDKKNKKIDNFINKNLSYNYLVKLDKPYVALEMIKTSENVVTIKSENEWSLEFQPGQDELKIGTFSVKGNCPIDYYHPIDCKIGLRNNEFKAFIKPNEKELIRFDNKEETSHDIFLDMTKIPRPYNPIKEELIFYVTYNKAGVEETKNFSLHLELTRVKKEIGLEVAHVDGEKKHFLKPGEQYSYVFMKKIAPDQCDARIGISKFELRATNDVSFSIENLQVNLLDSKQKIIENGIEKALCYYIENSSGDKYQSQNKDKDKEVDYSSVSSQSNLVLFMSGEELIGKHWSDLKNSQTLFIQISFEYFIGSDAGDYSFVIEVNLKKNTSKYVSVLDIGTKAIVGLTGYSHMNFQYLNFQYIYLNINDPQNSQNIEEHMKNNEELRYGFLNSQIAMKVSRNDNSCKLLDLKDVDYSKELLMISPSDSTQDLKLPMLKTIMNSDRIRINDNVFESRGDYFYKISDNSLPQKISFSGKNPSLYKIVNNYYRMLFQYYFLSSISKAAYNIEATINNTEKEELFNNIVMTVPNIFDPSLVNDLKHFLLNLYSEQIKNIRFISESDAIINYYLQNLRRNKGTNLTEYVLIYDHGAGTLDASYFKITYQNGFVKELKLLSRASSFAAGNYLDYLISQKIISVNDFDTAIRKNSNGNKKTEQKTMQILNNEIKRTAKIIKETMPTNDELKKNYSSIDLVGIIYNVVWDYFGIEDVIKEYNSACTEHLFDAVRAQCLDDSFEKLPLDVVCLSGRSIFFEPLKKVLNKKETYQEKFSISNNSLEILFPKDTQDAKKRLCEGAFYWAIHNNDNIHSQNLMCSYGILYCKHADWHYLELLNPITEPSDKRERKEFNKIFKSYRIKKNIDFSETDIFYLVLTYSKTPLEDFKGNKNYSTLILREFPLGYLAHEKKINSEIEFVITNNDEISLTIVGDNYTLSREENKFNPQNMELINLLSTWPD
jgi:hypothetical protein